MGWLDWLSRVAALSRDLTVLADRLNSVLSRVDDHERRLVRVETMIEIARPDGMTLRIAPPRAES